MLFAIVIEHESDNAKALSDYLMGTESIHMWPTIFDSWIKAVSQCQRFTKAMLDGNRNAEQICEFTVRHDEIDTTFSVVHLDFECGIPT